MKILNAESLGYAPAARELLKSLGVVVDLNGERTALLREVADADVLIVRLNNKIDGHIFELARCLKVIVTATTGLNHIDLEAADKRGIKVISLKGEVAFLETVTATAEHTWGLLISLTRNLIPSSRSVLEGEWDRDKFRGTQLSGKKLGVVGFGRLGRIVADYGLAFRMNVVFSDPYVEEPVGGMKRVSMEELLSTSDVVSIHVPYSPHNRNLIGVDQLAAMKSSAVLLNTSRGELIDEDALISALNSRQIGGAALDVLDNEAGQSHGWFNQHPLVAYARQHSNLIITPHIGGATIDSMADAELYVARKLMAYISDNSAQWD